MTINVKMLMSRQGPGGIIYASGSQYAVDDSLANTFVSTNAAVYVSGQAPVNTSGVPILGNFDPLTGGIGIQVAGNDIFPALSDLSAKPSSIQSKCFALFPQNISGHGVNRNTHVQFTTETHFDSMRIILANAQAVTQTGIQASIGVSATPIADVAGMNSFVPDAFVNVTWSAANNVTQAAGTDAKNVSYTVSDWMDISSVAPTSGNLPIVHLRVFQPSANTNISQVSTGTLAWMNAEADGRTVNYWYKDTTDLSQGMTAFGSGASVAPRLPPCVIQYRSRGKIRTIGCFGDSLAFGQGPANYGEGYTTLLRRSLSSGGRPVEFANFGMPGATSTQFYNNLVKLVAAGVVPHWSIYHAGSPNDVSTTITDVQVTTMRQQLSKAIDLLTANGSVPFVATWLPSNTAYKNYGATDSKRVAYNAQVMSMPGVGRLDIASAVSGIISSGQVQIDAAMNNADNLHINDVGNAAMAASVISAFAAAS